MCTDVYKKKCVQEKMCTGLTPSMCTRKNGAAIKEFFDVYNMCTDVYRCVREKMALPLMSFLMCTRCVQMCTDVYKKKMAPPLRSFLMCTRCVQMCTRCLQRCVAVYGVCTSLVHLSADPNFCKQLHS